MTEFVEFATKDVADSFREEYSEFLCTDDDRRTRSVRNRLAGVVLKTR